MSKIQLYHFHNGKTGGVHSVISNLTRFSDKQHFEHHIIYVINKDVTGTNAVAGIEGAASEFFFYYSSNWNFYHTCKQLAKLLPDDKAVIIAHDWIELGMASNLGLQNPLVFFVHGDYEYYYQLAQRHERSIDLFIPVAQHIELKLKELISDRANDICYLRFPVPANPGTPNESGAGIIFIGRLEEAKGYLILPAIAKKLKEKRIDLHWHIVGTSGDSTTNGIRWEENIPIKFYGNIPNTQVLQLMTSMKILILPSLNEGMPVAVIEGMKAGVIPVVNNIDGGIQELVIDNETGYKIQGNDVDLYVQKITEIIVNNNLAGKMRDNCVSLANELFDPAKNAAAIEEKLEDVSRGIGKNKYSFKVYGSRLDQPWLANTFTDTLRKTFGRG